MKKLIFTIFILSIFSKTAFSLDTNSIRYMPLKIGNSWTYNGILATFGGSSNWVEKFSVVCSRNVNNHTYYYLNSVNSYLFKGYYRVDSTTGSLYKYDSTGSCINYYNEILIDSLAAITGDSVRNCGSGSDRCMGTSSITIFGFAFTKILFRNTFSMPGYGAQSDRMFINNLGFYCYSAFSYGGGGGGSYSLTLKGCKIDGIVYGDTSMVGIKKIGNIIPENFSLSQNYPNPFNPATNIKYQIANNKFIRLVVYDILGKEVAVLVNEKMKPGEYEVQFPNVQSANVQLPSGVYFYSLFADGERIDTKKMVLFK
jgi:hypothetical protein